MAWLVVSRWESVMEPLSPRNTVITGFMGAGKNEVGLRVADALGLRFFNTDREFEKRYAPIPTYLPRREGEFRRLESVIFRQLLALREVVIATGGGTLANANNVGLAREHGVVVWLNVDFDVAAGRVKNDKKNKRPLWNDDIKRRFDFRQPLYRKAAHIEVDANRPIDKVVNDVLRELEQF